MAALSVPEQLAKLLYSCSVCQGKEGCHHGPTSSCSRGVGLEQPLAVDTASVTILFPYCNLLAATLWLHQIHRLPCNALGSSAATGTWGMDAQLHNWLKAISFTSLVFLAQTGVLYSPWGVHMWNTHYNRNGRGCLGRWLSHHPWRCSKNM